MTPVKFNEKEVREINEIIEEISKVIKPKSEIGARNRATLAGLLASSKTKGKPHYFKCKREYSDAIVNFFTKEKGAVKSRFSTSAQDTIFVL
ncbi:MAG: hypothetical protein JNJ75_06270 [Cyclobacteriaceae bacterium]|nr:hypothetical protein [Cyclobacteriaceae bacterium]